jgi:triacylglycerol esterase/lipase EstA (alpha/beta hydrolase family)
MHESWVLWMFLALSGGIAAAALFVLGSYLFALVLTRGQFGWPGLAYFVRETLWVSITQSLLPVGWLRSETVQRSAKGGRPIVLVHGFAQNRTNFVWLARLLRRRGLGPFFGFNYHSFGRIEDSARSLGRFVEHVVEITGEKEVDLVCHSLGGVVARTYVDLLGGHVRVRRVVTLGSPHRGVAHAGRRLGASVRDLQPRNGFIARLESAPRHEMVRYHSIYSAHDNVVFPHFSSSLGERGTDVLVHRQGHFGILFSEEVAEHVYRALTADAAPRSAGPRAALEVRHAIVTGAP